MSNGMVPESSAPTRAEIVDKILGNLLSAGVITSVTIVVLGLILLFIQQPEILSSAHRASEVAGIGRGYPHTPTTVITGVVHLEAKAIIMLGLLLLVATPVLRVLTSVFAFVFQKDWIFTCITTAVLLILLTAFWLGKR